MGTTFESNLSLVRRNHLEVTELYSREINIDFIENDLVAEAVAIQSEQHNPLVTLTGSESGIFFSLPSVLDDSGLLIQNERLFNVMEKDSERICGICDSVNKNGRLVITYSLNDDVGNEFSSVWIGGDCLEQIDTALDSITEDLDATVVSNII